MSNTGSRVDLLAKSDAVVHIGAGRCAHLPDYLSQLDTLPIILVEPNPVLAAGLSARVRGIDNVAVIESAVSTGDGLATLNIYNLDRFSSLQSPSGLMSIYPGLRGINQVEVDLATLNDVLSHNVLRSAKSIFLIVDAPGANAAILAGLQEQAARERVTTIVAHLAEQALYQGELTGTEVVGKLQSCGYDLIASSKTDGELFKEYVFSFNPVRVENEKIRAQLSKTQNDLDVSDQAKRDLAEKLAVLQSESDSQRNQSVRQREDLLSRLASVQKQNQQLTAELKSAHRESERLHEAYDNAQRDLKTKNHEFERQTNLLKAAEHEIEKLKEQLARAEIRLRVLRDDLEEAERSREGSISEIKKAQEQLAALEMLPKATVSDDNLQK